MSFSEFTKLLVWSKGHVVSGKDPNHIRVDDYGAFMAWEQYGNRNNPLGWEIDHIVSVALGGTDYLSNLRPLSCFHNASRQEGRY